MKPDWIDIGPLEEFPEGQPVLRKDDGGRRFACVLRGADVHAVDDRCPHQGYPLSQGTVRDCVLTCEWHNWKFDLTTGACTFGGEAVRRYPTRLEGGRILLNRAVDKPAEVRRLVAGLRDALLHDQPARALREALRIGEIGLGAAGGGLGALFVAFEVLARDGAERAEYGFDHGLALTADLCSWVERGWVPAEEAFVAAAHAIAEPSLHLAARAKQRSGGTSALSRIADFESDAPEEVSAALGAERRDEAEARMRGLVEVRGADGARRALLPFVSRHLYDYGHGAIFLGKALELAGRFSGAAEEVLAASTLQLAWATAETSLPPFAATRAALAQVDAMELAASTPDDGGLLGQTRAVYEAEVLAGERQAVEATVEHLRRGRGALALLQAIAHAAAVRLGRFDRAWERRLDAEVGVLDVTHAVTFAEAAIALSRGARPREAARLAVIAAGFVGKLRRGDAAAAVEAAPAAAGTLVEAVQARDVARALAVARDFDAAARRDAYRELAPFAAFDAAVRPIFYAHTVKTTEALHRLEAADPQPDDAYLRALLSYLVPARRELQVRRSAAIARKFLQDGRPPEGLY